MVQRARASIINHQHSKTKTIKKQHFVSGRKTFLTFVLNMFYFFGTKRQMSIHIFRDMVSATKKTTLFVSSASKLQYFMTMCDVRKILWHLYCMIPIIQNIEMIMEYSLFSIHATGIMRSNNFLWKIWNNSTITSFIR